MEPMTLGSPNGSPATEQYLPAFLLGDNGLSNTPKRNKLSPLQDRSLPFGNIKTQSPLSTSMHNDSDRITKTMSNTIKFGPPIIDLYDDMPSTYKLANDVFTPQSLLKKDNVTNQLEPNSDMYNASSEYRSPLSTSRPYQFNSTEPSNNVSYMAYKSPYMSPRLTNGDVYNTPNSMMSPPAGYKRPYSFNNNDASMYHSSSETSMMSNNYSARHVEQEFWVTIFGFPSELTREVVEFFKHIGNHTDIHMKPNCNYISVRYSSRYEARQALTYNGALYKPGIIIGVMLSEDPDFVGKDIINIASDHIDYKAKMEKLKAISSSSSPRDSPNTSNAQQKSSGGLINKTIEYIMRW